MKHIKLIASIRQIRHSRPRSLPFDIVGAIILGAVLVGIFSYFSKSASAAWFDDNWAYRQAIPVTNNTTAQTNVYISVTVDTSSTTNFQAHCEDVRFTKQNGELLPYYLYTDNCRSGSSVFHVEFDTFPAGAQTIYIYYGNPSATKGSVSADFATQASNYTVGTLASQEKAPSPLLYWTFNDGQGTSTKDSSSNTNTGTLGGTTIPTWQTEDQCMSGKCLYFDGATSKVTGSKVINNIQTISFWIRPNTIASQGIMNLNTNDTISTNASGVLTVGSGISSPTYYINGVATATPTLVLNQWNHVEITTGTGFNSTSSFTIGTDGTNYIKGFMDEVKFYDFQKSAIQVKADFNSRGSVKGVSAQMGGADQSYLSKGLVGYWKMDDNVSGNAQTLVDSSGNGNSGVTNWGTNAAGMDCTVNGEFSKGCNFDGVDDRVLVSNFNYNVLQQGQETASFTLAAWVKATDGTAQQTVVGRQGYDGGLHATNNLGVDAYQFRIVNSSYQATTIQTASLSNFTSWHHLVGVYNNRTMQLYLDGALVGTTTFTGTMYGYNTNMFIGGAAGASNKATEDEVRIYNRALSPKEVRDLYNWAPGPVAYYKLDEGSWNNTNGEVKDSSGNGYNGTASGASGTTTGSNYGALLDINQAWDTGALTNGTVTITGGTGAGQSRTISGNSGINLGITPAWTTPPDTTSTYTLSGSSGFGTPKIIPGKFGRAGKFNQGTNGTEANTYITIPGSNSGLSITGSITLSAWVYIKPVTAWADHIIIDKSTGVGGFNYFLEIREQYGFFPLFTYVDSNSNSHTWTATTSLTANQWQHVAISYTFGTGSSMQVYINGILAAGSWTTGTGNAATTTSTTYPLFLGSQLDGYLDDVKIYNYARTQKQIVSDMNGGHPNVGSPVGSAMINLDFDEGYGTTANNLGNGGSSENGTVNSGTWSNSGKFGKGVSITGSTGSNVSVPDFSY